MFKKRSLHLHDPTDGAGATGLIYLFSVYSSALKKRFDLSQRSLQTIEICMFLAGTCSGRM